MESAGCLVNGASGCNPSPALLLPCAAESRDYCVLGGLGGLPGGGAQGTSRPKEEGGDCWKEKQCEQRQEEKVDLDG